METQELFAGTVHEISQEERELQRQIELAAVHYYTCRDPRAREHLHQKLIRLRQARATVRRLTEQGKLL